MTTGAGCVRKFEKVVKLQCTEAMNNIVTYNKVIKVNYGEWRNLYKNNQ